MELILPDKKYYPSYLEAIREYREHGVHTHPFVDVNRYDVFERFEDFRTGKNLPEGYVKATYLWLVDGDEFIGESSIRHSLTDALLRYGGHIGYGVRYTQWKKGYGTHMLSRTLQYASGVLGLSRVLITCNDDNYGSARVIEKNGGILQDKVINTIQGAEILTRRYWIDLANFEPQI